ncbi:MAG: cytidine deaminase [Lachnospira sp.]
MNDNKVTDEELMRMAKEAMSYSYSPYSEFKVGAALLGASGKVYSGCNIENASYGATNCAERTAIYKAVSEGEKKFDAIAICSMETEETFPCGICLQVMAEFFDSSTKIILEGNNELRIYYLADLLGHAFKL